MIKKYAAVSKINNMVVAIVEFNVLTDNPAIDNVWYISVTDETLPDIGDVWDGTQFVKQ